MNNVELIQESAQTFVMEVCNVLSNEYSVCACNVWNLLEALILEFPQEKYLQTLANNKNLCVLNALYSTQEQEYTIPRFVEALILFQAYTSEQANNANWKQLFPLQFAEYETFKAELKSFKEQQTEQTYCELISQYTEL
jgi:hypothetical protein